MADQITMAEVADKVVNNISGGVAKLSEAIEKVAPGAWETLVNYHRMHNIMSVVNFVFLTLITFVFSFISYKNSKLASPDYNSDFSKKDALMAASVILGILSVLFFTIAANYIDGVIYPQYDAAVDIINRIK